MTVSDYIKRFSGRSQTKENEIALECLEHYALKGIRELTLEQAAEWWRILQTR